MCCTIIRHESTDWLSTGGNIFIIHVDVHLGLIQIGKKKQEKLSKRDTKCTQ